MSPIKVLLIYNTISFGTVLTLTSDARIDTNYYSDRRKVRDADDRNNAPIIIKPIENVVAVEDNVASFFCEAVGNPKPNFQWTRDGKRVTGRRYTELDMKDRMGSVLRIEPLKAEKDDGAVFVCVASNGISPPATQSANLTVLHGSKLVTGYPRVVQGPQSKVIEKGTMFSLPCEVTGNPQPTVTWLKDYAPIDLAIHTRCRLFTDGRLQVDRAEDVDYGEYQCIANNKWGSAYSSNLAKVWVKVRRVPPHFSILPPTRIEIARGTESTKINCVAVGSPMPYVRWKKLPSQIPNSSADRQKNLEQNYEGEGEADDENENEIGGDDGDALERVSAPIGKNVLVLRNGKRDANYSCIAASELGMIETHTQVVIKDLPPAPTVVEIKDISSRAVLLSWNPPFNPNLNKPYTYAIEVIKPGVQDDVNDGMESPKNVNNNRSFINVSGTEYELKSLSPNTIYQISLRTITSVGFSPPSDNVRFQTLEAAPTTPPRSIGTKALSSSEISIRWTEPRITNGKIKGYKIYYTHDADLPISSWPSLEVNSHDSNPQSLILPNLMPDNTYTIRLSALNSVGTGPLTDPLKIYTKFKVPGQVPDFKGTVASPYTVRLTWSKNLDWDIVIGYSVYYQDTKFGTQNSIYIDDPNTMSYAMSNLNADTLYHFKMVPRSLEHEGVPTPTIALKTHATIPVMASPDIRITTSELTSTSLRVTVVEALKNFTKTGRTDVFSTDASEGSQQQQPLIEGYKLQWVIVDSMGNNDNDSYEAQLSQTSSDGFNYETSFVYFPYPDHANAVTKGLKMSKLFEHLIVGLTPWTTYKVWVTPVLGPPLSGDGPPSVPHYSKTLEDVPGEPRNLSLKPLNSTSIAIMWEPPEESQRNGEIMGYLVHYREVLSKGKSVGPFHQQTISDGSVNQMILSDLKPESYYKVQVSAFTRKGDGYRSKAKVTRTMGGVPSAPNLSLRLLEEYPQLLLQAEWTRPVMTYGQLTGYKITYGPAREGDRRNNIETIQHTVELPGGNIYYYNVENLERGRSYQFTLSARNERGYGQGFTKLFDTPDGIPLNAPINFTYKFQTPNTVQLSWVLAEDTASLNGPIVLYELFYYKETTPDDPYIYNTTANHFTIKDLDMGNAYNFKVRSYTRKGCGPWTEPPLILHLADKASPSVTNVRVYAISRSSISLFWESLQQHQHVNIIRKYQIFYTSKVDQDYDNWNTVEFVPLNKSLNSNQKILTNNLNDSLNQEVTMDLNNLEPGTIYAIQIATVTDRGLGLLSSPLTTVLTEPLVVARDLKLIESTTNSLTLTWEEPIDVKPQEYEVSFQGFKDYTDERGTSKHIESLPKQMTIPAPTSSEGIILKNLDPYTTYQISVRTLKYVTSHNQQQMEARLKSLIRDQPAAKLTLITPFAAPPSFEWPPKVVKTTTNTRINEGIVSLKLPRASTINGPISHYLIIVVPQGTSSKNGVGINRAKRSPSSNTPNDMYTMDELTYSNGYTDVEAPYVAAMFPASEFSNNQIFALGDDKFYHTYHNRPLSPGKLYRVFQRAFAGLYDDVLIRTEGNTSRQFHQKYPLFTSSQQSEPLSLPLHPDISSSYNLLTAHDPQGPQLSIPNQEFNPSSEGGEKMKMSRNKKMSSMSWPLRSISLIIIALSIVFSLLIIALVCYFIIFYRRRKSNGKRGLLADGIVRKKGNKKSIDESDMDGTERKKLLASNNNGNSIVHHETSVVYSNAHNSTVTNCFLADDMTGDQDYSQVNTYATDTMPSNDKTGTALSFKNGGSSLLSAISRKSLLDKTNYNTKSLTRKSKTGINCLDTNNTNKGIGISQNMTLLTNLPVDPVAMRRFNYRTPAMSCHPPVQLPELSEYIAKLKTNDSAIFSQEYESIDPGQVFTWEHSGKDCNKSRNRYANVVAYDHTRVILTDAETLSTSESETDDVLNNDYINANYIDGYRKGGAYVATQGPLPETVADFWRMIWEQNTSIIVMLTKLEERTRIKCDQYWPSKGTTEFYGKGLQNTMIDCIELATYTIRTFSLVKMSTNEVREVKQFQFTAWPDHGVPDYPTPFLYFLKRVKASNPPNAGPLVVHCSAGVGRTGTFIVIDSMIERMKVEDTVDVYGHVTLMRAQRNFMVQTEDQYIFIYDSILEAYECGDTEIPAVDLCSYLQKLNAIQVGDSMTGLELEFKKLSNQKMSPAKFVSANFPVNKYKNRLVNILPFESNRVCLFPVRGVEGSDYINASFIDGYRTRNAYIATQGPLTETIEDFWRMLWEHNSNIIVMLTKLRENGREKSVQYWPIDCSVRYGRFVIEPVAEYTMPQYTLREFKVTDIKENCGGLLSCQTTSTTGIMNPPTSNTNSLLRNNHLSMAPYSISSTAPMSSCSAFLPHGQDFSSVLRNPLMMLTTTTSSTRTIRQFQFDYPIEEEACLNIVMARVGSGNSGGVSSCNNSLMRNHDSSAFYDTTNKAFMDTLPSSIRPMTSSPKISTITAPIMVRMQASEVSESSALFPENRSSSFAGDDKAVLNSSFLATSNHTMDKSTVVIGNNGLEEVFVDFVGQVHKTKEQFGLDGPITVHCGAGVGRTGVFVACSIALERMRYEGSLDIFQTVRALRTQRPGMVQTESQYKFCYRAALQYLRSFDLYAT